MPKIMYATVHSVSQLQLFYMIRITESHAINELAYLQTYVTKSQFGLNEQLTAEQCYKSVTKVYCNLSTFTVLPY